MTIQHEILTRIFAAQKEDPQYDRFRALAQQDSSFRLKEEGSVWMDKRFWVLNDTHLRAKLLNEAHKAKYTVHPGSTKMFKDLQRRYWWNSMKSDVADYVSRCLIC
jgi:hypothetical protein